MPTLRQLMFLAAAFAAEAAHAQSAAPPEPAASAPTQTITVTGERVGRSLAETTSSVTVLPEAEVRRRGGKEGVFKALDGAPNYTPGTPEELPPVRGERSSGPSSLGGGFLFGSTTRASLIVDDVAASAARSTCPSVRRTRRSTAPRWASAAVSRSTWR
jgi:iron complex outermembrane recepter protein